MTKADSLVRMPPLSTSVPAPAAPVDSQDSFPAHPATGQPKTAERTSESRKPFGGLSRHTTDQIGGAT